MQKDKRTIYKLIHTVYEKFDGEYCTPRGDEYPTFDGARQACSADPECRMFFDNCGEGAVYELCSGHSAQKVGSGCGSIAYQKEGKRKYVFCYSFLDNIGIFSGYMDG